MEACPLDPNVGVVYLDPREWGAEGRFANSHAFAIYGEDVEYPFMVIDQRITEADWFTPEHLLIIMAHELGHIVSGSTNEEVADIVGMILLAKHGERSALALYQEEVETRRSLGYYGAA